MIKHKKSEIPGYPTILVVEDDPTSMSYLIHLLQKLNINILAAKTGEEAIQMIQSKNVDCILMDTYLGSGISGLSLVEKLRREKRFAKTPIFVTSAIYVYTLEELLQKGFTDYLKKPYTSRELLELLIKYLPMLKINELNIKSG